MKSLCLKIKHNTARVYLNMDIEFLNCPLLCKFILGLTDAYPRLNSSKTKDWTNLSYKMGNHLDWNYSGKLYYTVKKML